MKTLQVSAILLTLSFINSSYCQAESSEKPETLSGVLELDAKSKSGGFGAPIVKFGPVAGKNVTLLGGRGAWMYNQKYFFGGGFYSNESDLDSSMPGQQGDLDFSSASLMAGYVHNGSALIHPVLLLQAGWANLEIEGNDDSRSHLRDEMTLIEPEALMEINVHENFKVGLGASYRMVSGIDGKILKKSQVEGWTGTLAFNFGSF
jgi:hypothetical protein